MITIHLPHARKVKLHAIWYNLKKKCNSKAPTIHEHLMQSKDMKSIEKTSRWSRERFQCMFEVRIRSSILLTIYSCIYYFWCIFVVSLFSKYTEFNFNGISHIGKCFTIHSSVNGVVEYYKMQYCTLASDFHLEWLYRKTVNWISQPSLFTVFFSFNAFFVHLQNINQCASTEKLVHTSDLLGIQSIKFYRLKRFFLSFVSWMKTKQIVHPHIVSVIVAIYTRARTCNIPKLDT